MKIRSIINPFLATILAGANFYLPICFINSIDNRFVDSRSEFCFWLCTILKSVILYVLLQPSFHSVRKFVMQTILAMLLVITVSDLIKPNVKDSCYFILVSCIAPCIYWTLKVKVLHNDTDPKEYLLID
jgi:hypothetical protein